MIPLLVRPAPTLPARCPARASHTAWLPRSCSPGDMAAATMQLAPAPVVPQSLVRFPQPEEAKRHRAPTVRTRHPHYRPAASDVSVTEVRIRPLGRRYGGMHRKMQLPAFAIFLPWICDYFPGAEAARTYESGAAVSGCPSAEWLPGKREQERARSRPGDNLSRRFSFTLGWNRPSPRASSRA